MTDLPTADSSDGIDESAERVAWEVPEIAAVAVLVATGVLIAGGVVAGIVASRSSYGGGTPSRIAATTAISFGATWAGPLLAIVLLGVVGLCWWQVEAWGAASEPDDARDRLIEVAGHMQRAHRISQWTQVALLVNCVGAVALVVSSALLFTGGVSVNPVNWARTVVEVANLLAVLAVTGVAVWIGQKVNVYQEYST